jgi:hypothetical protein
MKPTLKPMLAVLIGTLGLARAQAGTLTLDIEIPVIDTAEYHRPYIAAWLENEDRSIVRDLGVWYEQNKANDEGKKWLKDLRRWWRASGRSQSEPADGVSGATRATGTHSIKISGDDARLAQLPPGQYTVAIEAAREKGGHELVRLPLNWPGDAGNTGKVTQKGQRELGDITLSVQP